MKKLTVVIPAYNEEEHIRETLQEVVAYVQNRWPDQWEVIVVDDGSTDKTCIVVQEIAGVLDGGSIKLLKQSHNQGKGAAVRTGMLAASGEIRLFMDADNATTIDEFDKFFPYFQEGASIVIASRRHKESKVVVSEPILRIVLGQIYIALSNLLFGCRLRDFNCGFKAYTADVALKLFPLQRMNDWSFDTELIFLIQKFKLPIQEVPVRWAHKGNSKVKPLQAGISAFVSLVRVRFNDLCGCYSPKQ